MPNNLNEILKQLTAKYQNTSLKQSLGNASPLRQKSLKIFQKLDSLSDKYVKHKGLKSLIMTFVRPHIQNVIINDIPEDELKTVIKECFEMLKEDFEDVSIAKDLNDDLNKEFNEKLKLLPKYQELAKLL